MITDAGHAWDPDYVSVNLGNSGPIRVLTNDAVEEFTLRPVGFNTIATALVAGQVRPPAPLVVRKVPGWWKWRCRLCPRKFGGLAETQQLALNRARAHYRSNHGDDQ